MAREFVRSIKKTDPKNEPLYTTEQNDLISDDKNVYIHNNGRYEKITNDEDTNELKENIARNAQDISNLQLDNDTNKTNIIKLQNDNTKNKSDIVDLQDDNQKINQTVTKVSQDHDELVTDIKANKDNISKNNVKIEKLSQTNNNKKSILNGKIMNVIGDSYVANNNEPVENTWHYKIAKTNNMTYHNYGINGNCLVADGGTGTKVYDRYDTMDDNGDYILVVGGKNDYNQQISIADFSTQMASLIKKIVQKYQGKNVCFFTPWPDQGPARVNPIALHEYANAIEEQCGLLGVPCFNSSKYSGIAPYNAQFRRKYFQSEDDVSHLNNAGHDLFINKAQTFLESL